MICWLYAVSVMEKMAEWIEGYNNLRPHKGGGT